MKDKYNVLLLGKGGREAALAWKLLKSPRLGNLYSSSSHIEQAIHASDIDTYNRQTIKDFISDNDIDIVVVGQEELICDGIADFLSEGSDVTVIAPDSECARLEGSKEFAKEFMFRHAIPTPRFMTVTQETIEEGLGFLDSLRPPYVLKADGLAAGKGVIICQLLADAKDALDDMLNGKFGKASDTVIIEEYVDAPECSMMVAVNGENFMILPPARDYKRYKDGNNGPNTAGMGSISPVPGLDEDFIDKVVKRILTPTLKGLSLEGMHYRGFLFLGLMDVESEPMLIEYNVRLGDPETEAIIPRIETDMMDILLGIGNGNIGEISIEVNPEACAAIVLTAEGYPGVARTGDRISGIESSEAMIFAGAVHHDINGVPYTAGGRVAVVCQLADSVEKAAEKAIAEADKIEFEGKYFRRDIGK